MIAASLRQVAGLLVIAGSLACGRALSRDSRREACRRRGLPSRLRIGPPSTSPFSSSRLGPPIPIRSSSTTSCAMGTCTWIPPRARPGWSTFGRDPKVQSSLRKKNLSADRGSGRQARGAGWFRFGPVHLSARSENTLTPRDSDTLMGPDRAESLVRFSSDRAASRSRPRRDRRDGGVFRTRCVPRGALRDRDDPGRTLASGYALGESSGESGLGGFRR